MRALIVQHYRRYTIRAMQLAMLRLLNNTHSQTLTGCLQSGFLKQLLLHCNLHPPHSVSAEHYHTHRALLVYTLTVHRQHSERRWAESPDLWLVPQNCMNLNLTFHTLGLICSLNIVSLSEQSQNKEHDKLQGLSTCSSSLIPHFSAPVFRFAFASTSAASKIVCQQCRGKPDVRALLQTIVWWTPLCCK